MEYCRYCGKLLYYNATLDVYVHPENDKRLASVFCDDYYTTVAEPKDDENVESEEAVPEEVGCMCTGTRSVAH